MVGWGQTPFTVDEEGQAKPEGAEVPVVGGKTSIDQIRLSGGTPSVPLRNAGVVPGSESLTLDGRPLTKNEHYAIDYAHGILYLMVPFQPGQNLRATYRFDPAYKPSAEISSSNFLNAGGFKFQLNQGNSLMLGFGMADRTADGQTLARNLYGMQNSFGFGSNGGGIKGVLMFGERAQVQSSSLFEKEGGKSQVENGKSQAIIQELNQQILGGTVKANFSEITAQFTGFDSLKEAGFDDAAVGRLREERGLRRTGFDFQNIGGEEFNLSSSFKSVREGHSTIDWRSYGLIAGDFSLNWNSQRVGTNFTRFRNLGEEDRDQLAKERGLTRENLESKFAFDGGSTQFNQSSVEDESGAGFYRRAMQAMIGSTALRFSDQKVDPEFTRFGDLREGDRGQLAREQGVRRQDIAVQGQAPEGQAAPYSFTSSRFRKEGGDFAATDVSINGRGWSLWRAHRSATDDMTALGAMGDEANAHMSTIASMYQPGNPGIDHRRERGAFDGSNGLKRDGLRFQSSLVPGYNLTFNDVSLTGAAGKLSAQQYALAGDRLNVSYRLQTSGNGFTELNRLMQYEQAQLGTIVGLDKADLDVSFLLGGQRKFDYESMVADSPLGGARRTNLSYNDKGFEFSRTTRGVDDGFTNVGQLIDPERELLGTLVGFDQTETKLNWQMGRGITLGFNQWDAVNEALDQTRFYRQAVFNWQIDSKTNFNFLRMDRRDDTVASMLYDHQIERWSLARDLDRFGKFRFEQETIDYDGEHGTAPDSARNTIVYSTQLNSKTSFETSHTEIKFENGERETQQANTVSTAVSDRVGVSVTDVKVRREGDKPDENQRNYGFWWDFGQGLRLNYGYARQLNSEANGHMKSNVGLTQGQVGSIKVDGLGYETERWDTTRNRSTGKVQLSNTTPYRLGSFQDIQFRIAVDTARDRDSWQYENNIFALGTKLGNNSLSFEYFGQIDPSGQRAVDRTYRFQTDQSEGRPLKASVMYKLRTLPDGKQVMIRDYSITATPMRGLALTHQLVTNPTIERNNVILGSIATGDRLNRWQLDYTGSPSTKIGLSWEEKFNDDNRRLSRIGGVNLTLFANNPSPLSLFYGVEQNDFNDVRRTAHRYHLRFDQRPGENQLFSVFLGNLSWQHSRPEEFDVQNWTIRAEYQLRF